jgi:hypothetical protein
MVHAPSWGAVTSKGKALSKTLEQVLRESSEERRSVTQQQYDQSKQHLSECASWAVWGEKTGDLTVFDEPDVVSRLRKDVFLLGGNLGVSKGGRTSNFSNFHTAGHRGDTRLRKAITGTVLEGAYMTDVVKNYPTTDATKLQRAIRAGDLNIAAHVVGPLRDELDKLSPPSDVIFIVLGKGTAKVWDAVVSHPDFDSAAIGGVRVVTDVPHYTAPVKFAEKIREVLARPLD